MTPQHILIIDDEPAIGSLLQEAAESIGCQVTVTTSPDQFKRALLQPQDVLVIDLIIPGTDGIELLRYVATQHLSASIILISGVNRRVLESAQDLAVELGLKVLGVLGKPFRISRFLELLASQPTNGQCRLANTLTTISVDELQSAIQHHEWVVHYQPQIDFRSKAVVAVEALVRWQHPQRGLIFPDSFIAQAESFGLIDEITHAVMQRGLSDLALWRVDGQALKLAVNISAKSLVDLSWPDRLHQQVLDAGIPTACLMLEVTESGLMQDFSKSLDILTRLRMKGFLLSIDDFGTGYSSMQQIMRVPANELKIDKSFVMHMHDNSNAQIIVDQTIQMAHKLELQVVAEGVETAQAWAKLADAGCDIAQGFVVSRPLAAEKFTAFLTANAWREELIN